MGYYVSNHGISYTIKAANLEPARQALIAELTKPNAGLYWGRGEPLEQPFGEIIKKSEGFEGSLQPNGDFEIDGWDGEKWTTQEQFLDVIAPFMEEGGSSSWTGDDDERWELRVEGGVLRSVNENELEQERINEAIDPIKDVLTEIFLRHPEEAALYISHEDETINGAAKKALSKE